MIIQCLEQNIKSHIASLKAEVQVDQSPLQETEYKQNQRRAVMFNIAVMRTTCQAQGPVMNTMAIMLYNICAVCGVDHILLNNRLTNTQRYTLIGWVCADKFQKTHDISDEACWNEQTTQTEDMCQCCLSAFGCVGAFCENTS